MGPKNQSCRHKSGRRFAANSVYVDKSNGDKVQGILGAIGPFWTKWQNGGLDESRGAGVFFVCCNPEDLSATLQRPIFTKFGHET